MRDTLVRVLSRVRRLGRQRTAQGRLSAFVRLDARGRRPPSAAVEDVPGMGAAVTPASGSAAVQQSADKRKREGATPPPPSSGSHRTTFCVSGSAGCVSQLSFTIIALFYMMRNCGTTSATMLYVGRGRVTCRPAECMRVS